MLNDSECIHSDLQVRDRASCPAYEPNSCSTKRRLLAQDKVSEGSFTFDLTGGSGNQIGAGAACLLLPASKWLVAGAALKTCFAAREIKFNVL